MSSISHLSIHTGGPAPLEELRTARILLIDDDEDNLDLLEMLLRQAGARDVRTLSDPLQAGEVYDEFMPDLVILDLRMPPVDGFYVLKKFRELDSESRFRFVPVIMLTGDASATAKQRALEEGVSDFLSKNYDETELLLRVRNVLRTRQLYRQVQKQKNWLEETVRIRTRQLFAARREVLERLALASEFRDDQTGEHTRRVGQLSAQIAQRMGEESTFVESIGAAALLHDLGKIGIPDNILLKMGPLTPEEYELMKQHTVIGASILAECYEPVMRMAQEIALTHHERWDGSGYPNGLAGEAIPVSGRIVAVADAYDAMTNDRPYRRASSIDQAAREIVACMGRQFDPRVVVAFLEAMFAEDPAKLASLIDSAPNLIGQPVLFDA